MKLPFKIPTIFLFVISIYAYSNNSRSEQKQISDKPNDDWKIVKQDGYSIQYPSNWELNESGIMGTEFAILSPLESNEDKFRESVNLVIEKIKDSKIDIDKYGELSKSQISLLLPNANFLESQKMKNEGIEYFKMLYTFDLGVRHLKIEQYILRVKKKFYVLTFTTELDKFDNYKETGEKILNSFKIR